jgi:hypothetical protein
MCSLSVPLRSIDRFVSTKQKSYSINRFASIRYPFSGGCSCKKKTKPVPNTNATRRQSLHTLLIILPGAVDCRDGISFLASVRKEGDEIIASDDTRRNEIDKGSHGESVLNGLNERMYVCLFNPYTHTRRRRNLLPAGRNVAFCTHVAHPTGTRFEASARFYAASRTFGIAGNSLAF